jgi:aspartate aminotransferase
MSSSAHLSARVRALKPSVTLALTAEAKARQAAGEDLVNFGAGEPDFDTPAFIKRAAIDALNRGFTKYTGTAGIPELREAIAAQVKRAQGLDYAPSQVLVSVGAKQSLFNLCQAVLDPGDEAIVPEPYWLSYPEMVQVAGGLSRFAPCSPEDGFQLRRQALEAAATERTRLLFINSPSNPTGAVLDESSLRGVADFLRDHPRVALASDDIYERLTYGGARPANVLSVAPELKERVVLVSGFSKTFSMTGWRIGYALGPQEIVAAMQKVQDQSTSSATSFVQSGALAALTGPRDEVEVPVEAMRGEFDRRRIRMVELLRAIPGLSLVEPRGAFYALPSIQGLIGRRLATAQGEQTVTSGESFCRLLLGRGVAAIPGEPFGAPNHVRFSFALGMKDLERGLQRVAEMVSALRQ